jgi:ABC-type glycerol-3-phosphate transport system substrate-binding protein
MSGSEAVSGTSGRTRIGGLTRRELVHGAALAPPAAAGLAGCTEGGSGPAAPRRQPTTVRYLHVDTGQQVWQENWGQIFANFQTKNPDVTLQMESSTFGAPVIEKAIATFAAGDYYDVLYGHNSFLSPWLQANLLQPLDGFLAKDREVKGEDFHQGATERLQGKLYGIAWFVVGAETWYNADLLAQSGATAPRQLEREGKWTWMPCSTSHAK